MSVNLAEKVFVNHYEKLGSMNAYWMRVCGVKECVELQNATVEAAAVYNQHGRRAMALLYARLGHYMLGIRHKPRCLH